MRAPNPLHLAFSGTLQLISVSITLNTLWVLVLVGPSGSRRSKSSEKLKQIPLFERFKKLGANQKTSRRDRIARNENHHGNSVADG